MADATYLVVFTGAVISIEPGLPDFRAADVFWIRQEKGLPPLPRFDRARVKSNRGHRAIVGLEQGAMIVTAECSLIACLEEDKDGTRRRG